MNKTKFTQQIKTKAFKGGKKTSTYVTKKEKTNVHKFSSHRFLYVYVSNGMNRVYNFLDIIFRLQN